MSDLIRAFLGIDIEDNKLLSHISQIQQKLDLQSAKMKLVEINNIHFTIRFFGDTPVAKLEQMRECLQHIRIEPFEVRIQGVGAFPNKRRPRVVWVGVTDNSERIAQLKTEIDDVLTEIGYHPEREKYTPHATIARIKNVRNSDLLIQNLEDLAEEPLGKMIISSINMKKSTLTPTGAIYDTLWKVE